MREFIRSGAVSPHSMTAGRFRLGGRLSWRDPDIEATLVLSQPDVDPDLCDTFMFCAAIGDDGRMLAGLRAKGPLRSADESHAVIEWEGQPGQKMVRDMITDRIPFGVLEMKSGWVIDDMDANRSLTTVLARSGFYMASLTGFQFFMATAAAFVINRWKSSGGLVAPIPATPYPDERYQTKMIWWDSRDFINYAEPGQVAKILTENELLMREIHRRGDLASTWQEVV